MDSKSQEVFKNKLLKEQKKLEVDLKKMNKINDYGSSEEANVYQFEEREERLGFGNKIKNSLLEIEHSLKKIEDDKYGLCENCGEKIELGRLKIFPTATYCATCATKKNSH
ncbi:MAG: TraR/DksA C4-type zinc finger protein [Patescibacteria group bacterium]